MQDNTKGLTVKARISNLAIKQKIRQLNKTAEPLIDGMERQWIRCRECGWIGYYDYVPYGLCRPILTMGCGCGSFDDVIERI